MDKSIQNVLRVQGIKARGFGVYPKIVAKDPSISVQAKAVYGFFCSLAGRGDTVFPCRDTILRSLRMGRDTYYAALRELVGYGYITIEQEARPQGSTQFTRNIYTITAKPARYGTVEGLDEKTAAAYREVARHGLDVHGYGIVPYIVMSDQRMKSVDKAVYIYLSALSGARGYVDIDLKHMCHELGFQNIQRAQRHLKTLKELGYITAVQLHVDGRFSTGRYYINATPDMDAEHPRVECLTPAPKKIASFAATDPSSKWISGEADNLKVSRAEEQHVESGYTAAECGFESVFTEDAQNYQNRYTAKNTEHQKQVHGNMAPEKTEHVNQVHKTKTVTTSNITTTNFNISMIDRSIPQVRTLLHYQLLKMTYSHPEEQEVLDELVAAVAEAMCTTNPRITIGGQPLLTSYVREVLGGASHEAAFQVIERFLCRQDKVLPANRKAYLLSSLYREVLTPTPADDDDDEF